MNRHETIEAAIRRALGDMGVQQQREQDTPQQPPQYVPVEAVLSAAIGDRPATSPLALNADQALGRIAGGPGATINGSGW